jgi:MFS family permease
MYGVKKLDNNAHQVLSKSIRWMIFWVLFINCIGVAFSAGIMAPAGSIIKANLGLMDVEYGLFSGLYAIGRMAGAILFSCLVNNINRKLLLIIAAIIKFSTLVPFYFSNDGYFLLVCRLISGIGHIWPVIYAPLWIGQFGVKKNMKFMKNMISVASGCGRGGGYIVDLIVGGNNYKKSFLCNGIWVGACGVCYLLFPKIYFSSKLATITTKDGKELLRPTVAKVVSIYAVRKSNEEDKDINLYKVNKSLFTNGVFMFLLFSRCVILSIRTMLTIWICVYVQTVIGYPNKTQITLFYVAMIIFNPLIGSQIGGKCTSAVGGYKDKNSMWMLFAFYLFAVLIFTPITWTNTWWVFLILVSLFQVAGSAVLPSIAGIMNSCIDSKDKTKASWVIAVLSSFMGSLPAGVTYGLINDFWKEYDKKFPMKCFVTYGYIGLCEILIAICFRYKYESGQEKEEDKKEELFVSEKDKEKEKHKAVGIDAINDVHIPMEVDKTELDEGAELENK